MKKAVGIACIVLLALGAALWVSGPSQDTPAAVAAPNTEVSGNISTDTTWTLASSPYIVVGNVTIDPGVTLTIEPGVQVRFNQFYSLYVRGTLTAEGLPGQEILFTSNQATPAPGDWGVLDFRSDSQFSHLQYAVIEYGGNAYNTGASCVSGAVCVSTTSFMLEDSILRHSPTRGVVLGQSSASLLNNTFEHITWEAIRLHACDLNIGECHPVIMGNDFSYTAQPILHIAPQNPVLGGNTALNNTINGYVFYVTCNMAGNNTWYAGDLPYVVPSAGSWCLMGVWNRLTTVNIQPGTVVKLANSIQFHYNTVVTATGTADAPVIFTSLKDDSVGGDTNNDGDASAPAARDWGMIDHFGAQATGTYEHAVFRYGGGSQPAFAPTVDSDSGAMVSVSRSVISQSGGSGVRVDREGRLTLAESEIFDHRDTCIEVNSTGSVLVENNRIQGCPSGVLVNKGSPTIRGNYFEGNVVGVEVVNTFQAAPVVSPHNRFVGAGQMGVKNRYPMDGCIDARRNWWGDVSGPADTSTATDACDLADNPGGSGAPVSDGVDYYPWEGNLPRPIIASPGCGVTARDKPVFTGRAAEGSTVSFYDNGVLIGQTIAAANDSFTWSLPVPLADGEHSLSAVAELEGETSLPTPLLPLEVDSSLPFDPMGMLISYDMHGHSYAQRMHDENGCATLDGDLEMPIWVRPGTNFTINVPMRSEVLSPLSQLPAISPTATAADNLPVDQDQDAPLGTVTIHNSNPQIVTAVRVAEHISNTTYTGFDMRFPLDNAPISDTRTIELPEGRYDFLFFSGTANVADRQQRDIGGSAGWSVDVSNNPTHTLMVYNDTGSAFTEMYYMVDHGNEGSFIGGDFIFGDGKIKAGGSFDVDLPMQQVDSTLVLKDSSGAYHIRYTFPRTESGWTFDLVQIKNLPTTSVTVNYGGDAKVCEVKVISHNDLPYVKRLPKDIANRRAVNLLNLTNHAPLKNGDSFTVKLESGDYYVVAYDCNGKLVGEWASKAIKGLSATIDINIPCQGAGKLKMGGGSVQSLLQSVDLQCGADEGGFTTCAASSAVSASELSLELCYQSPDDTWTTIWEFLVGLLKIDPDGYVYNAAQGIDSKVPGATVTCEVYDEDYQAWSEWPAAFYENQVNPQVTASDGYYAFFVPPGLYRVFATAPGYASHTSPDIQVIDEIVHYNIPLEPTGSPGAVYLPLIVSK